MYIKSSAILPNDYNEIARLAQESSQPIYITRNGNGDTVIMDLEAFERREQPLALQERLLISEKERLAGETLSLEETDRRLQEKFDGKL